MYETTRKLLDAQEARREVQSELSRLQRSRDRGTPWALEVEKWADECERRIAVMRRGAGR